MNKVKEYDNKINFEKDLNQQLLNFKNNNNCNILEFSTILSNKDRYLVHQIANKLGLIHYSSGIGNNREIFVKKKLILKI